MPDATNNVFDDDLQALVAQVVGLRTCLHNHDFSMSH